MMSQEKLVDLLKEKIERDGLSMYAASRRMGVNPQTVKNWVSGAHAPRGIYRDALQKFLES